MNKLKILQINLGRGREASEVIKRIAVERGADIICITEPYHNLQVWSDIGVCYGGEGTKACVVVRDEVEVVTHARSDHDKNCVYLRVQKGKKGLTIGSVYAEKNKPLEELLRAAENVVQNSKDGIVITGDFNAQSQVWGGSTTDGRGEKILEWATENDLLILNEADDLPTYDCSRGHSWIDLTIVNKEVSWDEWQVLEEETLSDHRAIWFEVEICGEEGKVCTQETARLIFNKKKANWDNFVDHLEGSARDLERCENLGERWQDRCLKALRGAVPVIRGKRKRKNTQIWWNIELSNIRKKVNALRRKTQNTQNQELRVRNMEEYKEARNNYKKKIKDAKEDSFRRFCEKNSSEEPWGLAYKIWRAKSKRKSTPLPSLRGTNGIWTENEAETARLLLTKYFPEDNRNTEDREQAAIRIKMAEDFEGVKCKTFTQAELREAVWDTKGGKAPGRDGFPAWALKELYRARGGEWLEVVNWCLEAGKFPKTWKEAEIAWIPKTKGEFRPISLLPVIGKILDKLCARRLAYWLEKNGALNKRQYGFRAGRGTIEAIAELKKVVRKNKVEGLHSVVITLDIKNAFNSAWHPKIVEGLREVKCPKNLAALIRDFLLDREVFSKGVQITMGRGCPQGSSLGPVLWLLLMEEWFRVMTQTLGPNDTCQAFADDQVIVLADKNARKLESRWTDVWKACKTWASKNKLDYNNSKTEVMFIPHKRIDRAPVLSIDRERLENKENINYLGVKIDVNDSWLPHVKEARGKTLSMAQRIFVIAGKTWGVTDTLRNRVYDNVVVPMLTYGAEVWGEVHEKTRIMRQLNAAQRPFLLALSRAFRTAPTSALQAITGKPPLHLVAGAKWKTEVSRGKPMVEKKLRPCERVAPEDREGYIKCIRDDVGGTISEGTTWCCDASVRGARVGVSLVQINNEGRMDRKELYRLPSNVTVSRAEQLGLLWICNKLASECSQGDKVQIITDAKNTTLGARKFKTKDKTANSIQRALVEARREGIDVRVTYKERRSTEGLRLADEGSREAMELAEENVAVRRTRKDVWKESVNWIKQEWQKEWDRGPTGRNTYEVVRVVDYKKKHFSWKAVQMVTGHGYLKQYYKRFGLRETNGICSCGINIEDRDHVLWECEQEARVSARTKLMQKDITRDAIRAGTVDMEILVESLNEFAEEGIVVERT